MGEMIVNDIRDIIDDKDAKYYNFDYGESYVKVDKDKNHYLLTVDLEWIEYPKTWSWFWSPDHIYEEIDISEYI